MRKFFIETYGCQMNMAESNALENCLLEAGLEKAASVQDSDIVIINTCSVRQSAENRIWGRLGAFKYIKTEKAKQGLPFSIVLTGCMAQRLYSSIRKEAPQIDHVVGINNKMDIVELAKGNGIASGRESYCFSSSYYKDGDKASFVPIMNGCNNFCTYCIVPYVRGREVSRCPEQIYAEVEALDRKGVREITLLGQNVNSYDYEGLHFPALLREIAHRCSSIRWIRFESPHPKDFSDELIEVIATEDRVAKHLHIPMQSGSTRILGLMNRRYSREKYLDLIHRIKERIPQITFAVDVMVGFPSETEQDFEDTLGVMDDAGYIEAYMYYWNPREGTKAVLMDGQMSEKDKQERLQRLIDWQLAKAASIKKNRVGNVQEVLVTQTSRDNKSQMLGRNEHNEMVAFDVLPGNEAKVGDLVKVLFISLNGNTFVGRQV